MSEGAKHGMRVPGSLWDPYRGRPGLEGAEVLVLSAALDVSAGLRRGLQACLSADERARAERFRFAVHRDRFIVARARLREILGAVLEVAPGRLAFDYGARGKPSLARPFAQGDLRFNVTHAEGLALYAIARGREVGLDVEPVRPLPDAEAIAARFFSAREQAALQSLASSAREEAFFTCWTRKEAFVKATGDGLARPLDAFDVALLPGQPPRVERVEGDPLEAGRWSLAEVRPAAGYLGAVAVRGPATRLSWGEWLGSGNESDLAPRVHAGRGDELEAR